MSFRNLFFPLLALLLVFPLQTSAQESGSSVGVGDLDFYLVQAFSAGTTAQRYSLNHIGLRGFSDDDGFVVTAVLESYPAHGAGIERGDRIKTINGEPFHPVFSFNRRENAPANFVANAESKMLTIQRDGEDIELSLSPVFENLFDSFRTATLNSKLEFNAGNKVIGYVRFWGLSRTSSDLITYQRLFKELDHCDGIILDLRDSYGFLDLAHIDLALQNRNRLLQLSGNIEQHLMSFYSEAHVLQTEAFRKPMAVLINEETAGGPELLAYQLGKLERIVTIGTNSAGRLGQFNKLPGQESFKYQAAPNTLVDGEAFEKKGLSPEQNIPYPPGLSGRVDPQYQTAVDTLMGII